MELEAKRAAAAEAKEELTTIEAKVADIHTKYDRQLSRLDRKRREAAAEAAECDAEAAAIAEEEAEHDAAMAMVRSVNPLLYSYSALGSVVAGGWSSSMCVPACRRKRSVTRRSPWWSRCPTLSPLPASSRMPWRRKANAASPGLAPTLPTPRRWLLTWRCVA